MHQGWEERLNNFQCLSMELMLQNPSGTPAEPTWPHFQALSGTSGCQAATGTSFHSPLAWTCQNHIRDSPNSLPGQSWVPAPRRSPRNWGCFQPLFAFLPISPSACSVLLKMCILGPFLCLNWINGLIDIKWYPQWHNETGFKSGEKKSVGQITNHH